MKVNKYGCKVSGDVCLKHCEPLWCRHGCRYQLKDSCKCITYEYEKIGELGRWEEDKKDES